MSKVLDKIMSFILHLLGFSEKEDGVGEGLEEDHTPSNILAHMVSAKILAHPNFEMSIQEYGGAVSKWTHDSIAIILRQIPYSSGEWLLIGTGNLPSFNDDERKIIVGAMKKGMEIAKGKKNAEQEAQRQADAIKAIEGLFLKLKSEGQ